MKPGLVTFYDVRPGKRSRLFLQPEGLHKVHSPIKPVNYCIGYATIATPKHWHCYHDHNYFII